MKKIFPALGMLLISASLLGQGKATGFVFNDANGNGKKDRREQGIAGVSVSNGVDVVQTDAKGRYELAIGTDNIISVIKPSGFRINTNPDNLPQFFYIHKPEGSPKAKYAGVAPTGKLPDELNFGLISTAEKAEFTSLIFGDPQAYDLSEIDYFERGVVAEVEGIKDVAFGLSMGDLVGNDPDLFRPYIKAVKKVGIPWYNLLGNHDINFDATTDELSDESYEAHFGPANYAFNYGKVHFIVLDDVIYPDPRGGKGYWGGFRPDQLEFIKNDLALVEKDRLIVIAMHIPLSEPWGDAFRDEDRLELFRILKDFPHTLSLSAHTHLQKQDYFGKADGWLQEKPHHHYNVGTTSGDWYSGKLDDKGIPIGTMRDGTPKGYAFIHFKDNAYTIDYKVAGKPNDYQMELYAPRLVSGVRKNKAYLYANFFMGSPSDELRFRVDSGEWKKMEFTGSPDPSYLELLREWDRTDVIMPGRRSSNAEDCQHLWVGRLPHMIGAGEHTIEVEATDRYGKKHAAKTSYKIEIPEKP